MITRARIHLFTALAIVGLLAAASAAWAQILNLPPRPAGAPTGSELVPILTGLNWDAREEILYEQVLSGNIPDFLRNLVPVTVSGSGHTATFYVTPDYLALGIDTDYFLMPMTPILAQWLADATGCSLPTRKMVNDIWSAADVHLSPSTIPPSPEMTTIPVFWTHNTTVWGQRSALLGTNPLGDLIGGHKKDVVITPQLPYGSFGPPNRVAIYGWHYTSGTPIQPLYLGHVDWYADYSHGIRLIQNAMTVDSISTTVQAVLADATLNVLLSDEGVISDPRYDVPAPPESFPYSDSFPSTGRELSSWTDRFTTPQIVALSPASPGGDGYVLQVRDPSGGIDTTRLGRVTDSDYSVECDIYCEHRPAFAGDGFERLGIFARDDGNGMFEGISGGGVQGNGYALTWDSGDGRVQCLRTVNGVPTDLLGSPMYRASTSWRHFRIDAFGDQIKFIMDGQVLLEVTDSTHTTGQFGIGFHEYFTTNSNLIGTRADNFSASLTAGPVSATLTGLLQR